MNIGYFLVNITIFVLSLNQINEVNMSKSEKQEPYNNSILKTKFSNLVFSPASHKSEYLLDDKTVEALSSFPKWKKDLMVELFTNSPKKNAIEQFPNIEAILIKETVISLIEEVKKNQSYLAQGNDFCSAIENNPPYSDTGDTKQKCVTIGKKSKITLTINIDPEGSLKKPDIIEDFILFCKKIWIMVLQFAQEKKLDLEQFIENCEKEISNFLETKPGVTIENDFEYTLYNHLYLSGSESPEEFSFSD